MSLEISHLKELLRKQLKLSSKMQDQNNKFEKIIYGPSKCKMSKSLSSFGKKCNKENTMNLSNKRLSFVQLKNLT